MKDKPLSDEKSERKEEEEKQALHQGGIELTAFQISDLKASALATEQQLMLTFLSNKTSTKWVYLNDLSQNERIFSQGAKDLKKMKTVDTILLHCED